MYIRRKIYETFCDTEQKNDGKVGAFSHDEASENSFIIVNFIEKGRNIHGSIPIFDILKIYLK